VHARKESFSNVGLHFFQTCTHVFQKSGKNRHRTNWQKLLLFLMVKIEQIVEKLSDGKKTHRQDHRKKCPLASLIIKNTRVNLHHANLSALIGKNYDMVWER